MNELRSLRDRSDRAVFNQWLSGTISYVPAEQNESLWQAWHQGRSPLLDALASSQEEIERCHARLEIDHHFVMVGDDKLERREVPMEERADEVDGIEARDCTIALQDERIASLEKALAEERERNRKLHRRAQIAEAVNQSVEGILAGWKDALKDRYAPHNQKWLLFSLALDDITKQRERIAARALASKAGAA